MADTIEGNPLRALAPAGQSVWIDQLRRDWLLDGTVARWIERDDVRGMTSNPAIFRDALAEGDVYAEAIQALAAEALDPAEAFERLAVADIQAACALFHPVWEATEGLDGRVSLEVSPALAHDTQGTLREALRLWRAVDRPNLMIKVPATAAGLPAIRSLVAEGIPVNVTLVFSLGQYQGVVEAYLDGLEDRLAAGLPLAGVHSVASVFVSRVDSHVDRRLDALTAQGADTEALRGRAAIANARRVYRRFRALFESSRFERLARRGALPQRVLWASTSTKDPAYRDVRYVEELVGPHTVNTMPLATLEAFRDHGRVARTVDSELELADALIEALCAMGIDVEEVGETLCAEGVRAFAEAQEALLASLARHLPQPEA